MKRKVKAVDLTQFGACQRHLKKFMRKWPDGVFISAENVLLAEKAGLDIDWLVEEALEGREWQKYQDVETKLWYEWFHGDTTHKVYKQKRAELISKVLQNHWRTV